MSVSVIVPVFNSEKYLSKCLDSLVNQTLKDLEVIIVNDGSTDNSQSIIDHCKKKHPNLIKSIKTQNRGQAAARNLGIEMATKEFIGFVDSDDWIDYNMFKEMHDNAIKHDSDIVVCDMFKLFGNRYTYMKGIFNSEINKKEYMIAPAGPCNKIYKRDIFLKNKIKFLENRIYEDLATIPLVGLYAKQLTYVNKPLYMYVQRKNSTMNQTKYNKKLEDIFYAIEHLEEELKRRGVYNKYFQEIEFININDLMIKASERFSFFDEGKMNIAKIKNIMISKYPNWKKNKYYVRMPVKYKLEANLYFSDLTIIYKVMQKTKGLYIKFLK